MTQMRRRHRSNGMDFLPYHAVVRFFRALYKKCKSSYINLRFLPSGINHFIPLPKHKTIPRILKEYNNENAHFGVATRAKGDGTKEGIIQIPALWADLDFNGRSHNYFDKKLKKFPLKTSALVKTGGGYQAYWFLVKPLQKSQIHLAERLLKRLASRLDADVQATDASHLLRIPGSINFKRGGFKTEILTFAPKRRYRLSDFDCLPSLKEEKVEGPESQGWADKLILEGVPKGERNSTIARLAGHYARKDLTKVEIMTILLKANRNFQPPLEKKEVRTILASISRAHLRNEPKTNDYKLTSLRDIFKYQAISFVIERFMPEGTIIILGGYTGEGKSVLVLSIIKSVLTGAPLWGQFPVLKIGPVLFVDEENPQSFLRDRLKKMRFGEDLPLFFLHFQEVRLDHNQKFKNLMEKIEEVNPVVVVIDSLIRVHHQKENEASVMAKVIARLRSIANMGTTVLVIHHHKKGDAPLAQKLRGSTDILGGVDISYALTRRGEFLILESVKSRIEPIEPVRLRPEFTDTTIDFSYCGTASGKKEAIIDEVENILIRRKGWTGIEEIIKELRKKKNNVGVNALRKNLKGGTGHILEKKGPKGKNLYSLDSQFNSHINTRETVNQRAGDTPDGGRGMAPSEKTKN